MPDPSLSPLSFWMHLPLREIERGLDTHLDRTLYEGTVEGKRPIELQVERKGKIRVFQKRNVLYVQTRVYVKAQERSPDSLLSLWKKLPLVDVEKTEFSISVRFACKLSLQPGWELRSQTEGSFRWKRRAKVGIGLARISISGLIAPELQKQVERIARRIDRFIDKQLSVPTLASEAWHAMGRVHGIHDSLPLWLRLVSQEADTFACSSIYWMGEAANVEACLPVLPEIFLRTAPPPSVHPRLPTFIPAQQIPPPAPTRVRLLVDKQTVADLLSNTQFSLGKRGTFDLKGVEAVRSEEGAGATFSWKGMLTLRMLWRSWRFQLAGTCTISLRPPLARQWIRLKKVSAKVHLSGMLANIWTRVVKKRVLNAVHRATEDYLLGVQYQVSHLLAHELQQLDVHDSVRVDLQLDRIVPLSLEGTSKSLVFLFSVEPEIHVNLRNLGG